MTKYNVYVTAKYTVEVDSDEFWDKPTKKRIMGNALNQILIGKVIPDSEEYEIEKKHEPKPKKIVRKY